MDFPPVEASPCEVSDPCAAPLAPSPEPGPVVVVVASVGAVDDVVLDAELVVDVDAVVVAVVELIELVVELSVVGAADSPPLSPSEPGRAAARPMPATNTRSEAASRSLAERVKRMVGFLGI